MIRLSKEQVICKEPSYGRWKQKIRYTCNVSVLGIKWL